MHFHQLFFPIVNWSQHSLPFVLAVPGLILTAFGLYYSYRSYQKSRSSPSKNNIKGSRNTIIKDISIDNSNTNGISGKHFSHIVYAACLLIFAIAILFFFYHQKPKNLPEPDPIKTDTIKTDTIDSTSPPDSIYKALPQKEDKVLNTIRVLNPDVDMDKFAIDLCHAKNYQNSGLINKEIEIYEQIYSEIKGSSIINNKQQLQIAHEYYIRTEINASVKVYRKVFSSFLKKCSHNS